MATGECKNVGSIASLQQSIESTTVTVEEVQDGEIMNASDYEPPDVEQQEAVVPKAAPIP